jgi:predicted acetyltransferase
MLNSHTNKQSNIESQKSLSNTVIINTHRSRRCGILVTWSEVFSSAMRVYSMIHVLRRTESSLVGLASFLTCFTHGFEQFLAIYGTIKSIGAFRGLHE